LNLIDRYLFREWLKMLGLVLAATLGLLLMQAMFEDFRDLLANGARFAEVVFYYMIKLPSYLSVVLPLALLVSLLYTLGQLHRNNEITAMRAAGVGLFRITRSIWAVGLLLCGLMWYINATVIPWSMEESRAIKDDIKYRQDSKNLTVENLGVKPNVAFDNRKAGRMWFFNRYSQFSGRGYGVSVVELDSQRREKSRLLAREALVDPVLGGWVFRDGRQLTVNVEDGEVDRSALFTELRRPDWDEDPALMLIFDAKPHNLSITQLERIIAFFSIDDNPKLKAYQVRYYGLLADTLSPLIIIALAIPFAVSGVRVNPAVGVSKSLGLFVVYFVLLKISSMLGGRDVIPVLWAALLPSLTMLGAGLFFLARVR
jgi:lipopolysaccharide export system permease protein